GSLRIAADAAAGSAVARRHALPTSGGGPLLVRDGKILFGRMPLVTLGGLRARLDGSIAIGSWAPDLTLFAETRDLAELERTAENWYAAIQGEPLAPPLRLTGSGSLEAHLTRAFGDPHIEGSFEASSFSLRGARFGEATASFTVDRNVATFAPFAAEDGGGELAVTGKIGWGGALGGHYRLDELVTEMRGWPLERILAFLDFDLPMSGPLTGRLALSGVTPALAGRAPVVWEKGSAWGQGFDRLEGTLAFEKDRIRVSDAVASLGGGTGRGSGFYRWSDGGFDLALEAAGVAAGAIARVAEAAPALTGRVTATLAGDGTIEKPGLTLTGSIDGTALGESPLGEPGRPVTFSAKTGNGGWSASLEAPGAAVLSFETPPADGAPTAIRLSVSRLGLFAGLLGVPSDAGFDGRLDVAASIRSAGENAPLTGEGALSTFSARLRGRAVSVAGPVPFRIGQGRVLFDRAELTEVEGPDGAKPVVPSTAVLSGSFGFAAPYPLDVAVSANLDASLLAPFVAPASLSGRLLLDGKVGGSATRPEPAGRAALEAVDYRTPGGSASEGITGTVLVSGDRRTARDVTMRALGGAPGVTAR
ncbi:MAG TPA: hypothetical protein PLB02_15550, partial [Thermoanaerobaculia bacterium]|nr:hypothetical protein [Thermoanaerobaculia bacterium]